MSENCDVIVIFLIYGQVGVIRKSDCGRMVYKTYIFIKSHLLSWKSWKYIQQSLVYCFEQLWQNMLIFCKINTDISKIKCVLVLKSISSENKYVCVLMFQSSRF